MRPGRAFLLAAFAAGGFIRLLLSVVYRKGKRAGAESAHPAAHGDVSEWEARSRVRRRSARRGRRPGVVAPPPRAAGPDFPGIVDVFLAMLSLLGGVFLLQRIGAVRYAHIAGKPVAEQWKQQARDRE